MDLLSRLFIFYFWKTLGPSASSKMIADLFSVPKTTFLTIQKTKDIKFLISGKFEVTIILRKSEGITERPSEQVIYRNDSFVYP